MRELVDTQPPPSSPEGRARIRLYDVLGHVAATPWQRAPLEHLKIGWQNLAASFLMIGAARTRPQVPAAYRPAPGQLRRIEKELFSRVPKDRFTEILLGMLLHNPARLGTLDWPTELSAYGPLDYPSYYLQPFHSLPGGWLCPTAALFDRAAMDAIYRRAHPQKSLGIREAVAALFPPDARCVYDLGAGTCDQSAAIARRLPGARVVAVDASPFMLIVAQRLHGNVPNLAFEHALAERLPVPREPVDAVNISLVFHEIPNFAKRMLLEKAFAMLRPGGTIVLSDVPSLDLEQYRGFFEPYRLEWQSYDPGADLASVGFRDVALKHVVAPRWMWTRVATKPT